MFFFFFLNIQGCQPKVFVNELFVQVYNHIMQRRCRILKTELNKLSK